jgi:hypothetical protein
MGWTKCNNENMVRMKQTYLAVYSRGVNYQWAGATAKLFSQAANLVMLPATHGTMDALAESCDNLVLAATSNRTTVQQLTSVNLSVTMSVATLTEANKKLTKTVACYNLVPQERGKDGGRGGDGACCGPKAIRGNYCWTHGYKVLHTRKTCNVIDRKLGNDEGVTGADTKGGADFNKDWYLQGNRAP